MLLIFDFDGTLADTFWVVINTYNAMAPHYHARTVAPQDIATMQDMGYWQGFRRLGIKWYTLPVMLREGRQRIKKVIHEAPPFPGLVEALKEIKDVGGEYGIVTSNNQNVVRAYLRDNDFPKCDFIKGNQGLFTKHRAIKKMAQPFLARGEKVYYIGDEPRDIDAARKAGVIAIAASWGFASAERLSSEKPDQLISSPKELTKLQ